MCTDHVNLQGRIRRVIHVELARINFAVLHHLHQNALSHSHLNSQAKLIRLRPKMAPPLLPTSSSSKPGRAGSIYSFEDSYSRGGGGNGVEAYTLPKGERGLPLVLRRLGKFKSMVCPLFSFHLNASMHQDRLGKRRGKMQEESSNATRGKGGIPSRKD